MFNFVLKHSILLLLLLILPCEVLPDQICDWHNLKRFDENVAKLLAVGNSGRKFPEDKEESLNKYCNESIKLLKDLEESKDCFNNLSKQLFTVLIYTAKNKHKQLCTKDSQQLTEIIGSTPCLNANNDVLTKCYTNLIDSLLGIKNAENSLKIPYLCCETPKMYGCLEKGLKYREKCSEKHIEIIVDYVRTANGNAVDFLCGDYTEDSDKCDSLGPAPKKTRTQRRTKSFAIPLIDLIASVPKN